MYDKYTKKSRRFGFVTMKTVEDANAAVEKLNGTVSLDCVVILAAFQYFNFVLEGSLDSIFFFF